MDSDKNGERTDPHAVLRAFSEQELIALSGKPVWKAPMLQRKL
jgi:hypothetical protein